LRLEERRHETVQLRPHPHLARRRVRGELRRGACGETRNRVLTRAVRLYDDVARVDADVCADRRSARRLETGADGGHELRELQRSLRRAHAVILAGARHAEAQQQLVARAPLENTTVTAGD